MTLDGIDQLTEFLSTLYHPDDIIELRPIEIWTDAQSGHRRSQVFLDQRAWLTATELAARYPILAKLNLDHRANLFMGVNPRSHVGAGNKENVRTCRALWADMDEVTPEVARWRCQEPNVPDPSVLVDSGSGVHLYWLLERAVDVRSSTA
jgi:hypothetical protein